MTEAVFEQTLARAVEFRALARGLFDDSRVTVSLCGLGEPLLNPCVPTFVRRIHDAGFRCALSTNASLLDEQTGHALLDAGLRRVFINAGDVGTEYESIYALPFERTRDNIVGFAAMAANRCEITLVLVGHDDDAERETTVKNYWRERGVYRFAPSPLINRGGSLDVESMQFRSHPYLPRVHELLRDGGPLPVCGVPFRYLFVGYDGQYYLCSSDWEKQVPLGSVFDESFASVTRSKLQHVASREPICASCSHDPLNRLTERFAAAVGRGDDPSTRGALLEEEAAADLQVRTITNVILTA